MSKLSTDPLPKPFQLSEEGVEKIHETSMHILENIGIKVDHEEALEHLRESGAEVGDDRLVKFPRSLVMESIDRVPESFTLHARNPDNTVEIGPESDGIVLGPGYGMNYIVKYGESRRRSTVDDYEDLMKLVQMEEVVDYTGYNVCEPNDVPQEVKHLEMVKRNVLYTDKVVLGSPYGSDRARDSIELARIAIDDPDSNSPFIGALFNNVAPRQWDTRMTDGMVEFAKQGQVVLVGALIIASASAPSTIAGAAAQANAEALAGITIAQLVNPGVPTVYAAHAGPLDVRTGALTMGAPETSLFATFCGQMGSYYDMPYRIIGALTDAKTVDEQSGTESTLLLGQAMQSDPDVIMHAFGVLDSWSTVSPEKFVLDAERVRYIQRLQDGYDLTEETLAVDLIEDIEPGGNFINQQHTLDHSVSDYYFPEIFSKQTYDDWENEGQKDAYVKANERVNELLDAYERPPIDESIEAEIEEYVEAKRTEILGDE